MVMPFKKLYDECINAITKVKVEIKNRIKDETNESKLIILNHLFNCINFKIV